MNKRLLPLLLFCAVLFCNCNIKQEPYLKHKLVKRDKLAGGCEAYNAGFKMVSNIVGERYEFQKCLNATYDGHYTAERKGDTVAIQFTKAEGPQALYNITLDVDAWPRYHFLTIDETTVAIIPTQN